MQIDIKKVVAMTLAEVLIAMAILGTVAALTISTLKVDTDKAKVEGMFKKAYYMLEHAIDASMAAEGEATLAKWSFTQNDIKDRLTKNLPLQKTCTSTSNLCFGSSYRTFSGTAATPPGSMYAYLLTDGIAIGIPECADGVCEIYVDLTGAKKPNFAGVDLFVFKLDSSGLSFVNDDSTYKKYAKSIMTNNWKVNYW